MKIELKYNPYKVETEIVVNGKALKPGSFLNEVENKRLQEWVESFPKEISEEVGVEDYSLDFYGTQLDFDDVVYAFEHSEKFKAIKPVYCGQEVRDSDKIEQIKELFEEVKAGEFEELKTPELVKTFEDVYSNTFEASVVATMSAGKSTLINALLGQDLMPSKQEACTAIITKIEDDDRDTRYFDAKKYSEEGEVLDAIETISPDELQNWNEDSSTSKVELIGNIPFVSTENTKLVLVDTPGPNNSRNENHAKKTYESLGKSSKTLIIYILNASQLKTNDDERTLRRIADSMKVGDKKSRDRYIFVVNKLDQYKPGKDDIAGSLKGVKEYLEDFGIVDPNIFGVSAQNALEIRTLMKDKSYEDLDEEDLDEEDLRLKIRRVNRYEDYHFEKYAPLIPSHQKNIQSRLKKAEVGKDKKEEALIHSGIPSVEEAIKLYVNKYAVPQKIKTMVDTFHGTLDSLKVREKLEGSLRNNEIKREELDYHIKLVEQKIEDKTDKKEKFSSSLSDESLINLVEKHSENLINEASKELDTITAFTKGEKYEEKEARVKYDLVKTKIKKLIVDMELKAEEVLTDNVNKRVEELVAYYESITKDLFENSGESEKLIIDPFKLSGFNATSYSKDNLTKLIQEEDIVIGTNIVSNSTWYKPWTWFSEREVDVTETRTYIDAGDFMMLFSPATTEIHIFFKKMSTRAKRNQEKIDDYFDKEFDRFDKQLHQVLTDLKDKTATMNNTELDIKKNQEQIVWLNGISEKLDEILAI
ncbi:dynamin family protein [Vagococcus fessus]|uniref:dynamin family protein n=1 Tax=Vagococcus fessus TaxID=120370 RepID=UPI001473C6AC|nr:dynamin family protein [Vagococcus fessus]